MKRSAAFLAALLLLLPAHAQDAPAGKEALTPGELAARQAEVGERLGKIEDTMARIAKILAGNNPELAARLRMAWQRSQADRNLEKIAEIENLLKEEYFSRANEEQKNLEAALMRLLDILLDRDAERKDLQEKIEKLEDVQALLNKVIQEERDHQLKTEKFADPEKALQNAAAAKAKLKNLIEREQQLTDRTKTPARDTGIEGLLSKLEEIQKEQRALRAKQDAAAQEALAKRAADLAGEIGKYSEQMPEEMKGGGLGRRNPAEQAGAALQSAAGAMADASAQMKGGSAFEGRQSDAEQDLREAAEALRRLEERRKQHEEKRLGQDQERIRKDTERLQKDMERLERSAPGTDSGSAELGKAQQKMQEAEGSLDKGRLQEAVPHEEEARKELERAYEKLEEFEKELKRLLKLPDYDKLAEEQDDTTEKTDELLKKMKGAGGEPGAEGGEPSPGQGGVEGAKKAMQRASRNLRSKSGRSANQDQKEAVERLEKAREELEEALRQLREEEQLMLLEALERRLTRMLQAQTKYFKETISLNIRMREAKQPTRADADKSRQLADGEAELAVEAEKVLEILREEGTTVVIPDVVEDMKKDLDGLAARLKVLDAGAYTQQIQQDVIETLKELILVIQEQMERKQGGEGGEPQEGGGEDNLLPTSAELKMLKSLQVRVNRRTSEFDRLRVKEEGERGRIAEKQDGVGELTRTMADKLNRQEDE